MRRREGKKSLFWFCDGKLSSVRFSELCGQTEGYVDADTLEEAAGSLYGVGRFTPLGMEEELSRLRYTIGSQNLQIFISSHLHIFTSSHLHILSLSLSLSLLSLSLSLSVSVSLSLSLSVSVSLSLSLSLSLLSLSPSSSFPL